MNQPPSKSESAAQILEPYRGYLQLLAEWHLDPRLQSKIDASDVVQQTMQRAHAALADLRDRTPAVLAAWLRQILSSELMDTAKHYRRDRRNVGRERSIAHDIDQSSAGLEAWIIADQTSPSLAAARNENLLRLANALLQLPEDQREVVTLKHLKNMPLQQIAADLNRTTASVAGLLRRGLAQLRSISTKSKPHDCRQNRHSMPP